MRSLHADSFARISSIVPIMSACPCKRESCSRAASSTRRVSDCLAPSASSCCLTSSAASSSSGPRWISRMTSPNALCSRRMSCKSAIAERMTSAASSTFVTREDSFLPASITRSRSSSNTDAAMRCSSRMRWYSISSCFFSSSISGSGAGGFCTLPRKVRSKHTIASAESTIGKALVLSIPATFSISGNHSTCIIPVAAASTPKIKAKTPATHRILGLVVRSTSISRSCCAFSIRSIASRRRVSTAGMFSRFSRSSRTAPS